MTVHARAQAKPGVQFYEEVGPLEDSMKQRSNLKYADGAANTSETKNTRSMGMTSKGANQNSKRPNTAAHDSTPSPRNDS